MHLRDAEPFPDLGLAKLEPEAHHEDRLRSPIERAQEIAHMEAGLERRHGILSTGGVLDDVIGHRGRQRAAGGKAGDHVLLVEFGSLGDLAQGRRPALRRRKGLRGSLDPRRQVAPGARHQHRGRPTKDSQHLADDERGRVGREGGAAARVLAGNRGEQADNTRLLEILSRRPALEPPGEAPCQGQQALDERIPGARVPSRRPGGERVGRLRHRG